MEKFAESLRRGQMLESSVKAYTGDVKRFADWVGDVRPATLTYMDVAAYRTILLDRGLGAATVNRALNAVQCWMRWAGNEDAGLVRFVSQGKRLAPRGLMRSQLRALLRAVKQCRHPARNMAIVQLMAQGGLRVREVARLNVGDVQLNGRSGDARVLGKGVKQRTVSLNLAVRKAVAAWLEVRGEGDGEALFISQRGTRLAVRSIQEAVQNLMKRAGVSGSAHTLRHTFAREYLAANGNDLVGLARLLGHASLNTTAIYTQPTQGELAARVERLAIAG